MRMHYQRDLEQIQSITNVCLYVYSVTVVFSDGAMQRVVLPQSDMSELMYGCISTSNGCILCIIVTWSSIKRDNRAATAAVLCVRATCAGRRSQSQGTIRPVE